MLHLCDMCALFDGPSLMEARRLPADGQKVFMCIASRLAEDAAMEDWFILYSIIDEVVQEKALSREDVRRFFGNPKDIVARLLPHEPKDENQDQEMLDEWTMAIDEVYDLFRLPGHVLTRAFNMIPADGRDVFMCVVSGLAANAEDGLRLSCIINEAVAETALSPADVRRVLGNPKDIVARLIQQEPRADAQDREMVDEWAMAIDEVYAMFRLPGHLLTRAYNMIPPTAGVSS